MNNSAEILQTDGTGDGPEIVRAAEVLQAGGLVVFPTETVYGLAAAWNDSEAVERLRNAKRRPETQPFAALIADVDDVYRFVENLPPGAGKLMERFWPGPMTLVLPARQGGTVGLRLPDHALARAIIRAAGTGAAGTGFAATSVNLSGEPPLASISEIVAEFGVKVDLIIDGGPPMSGRPSSVIMLNHNGWRLLREGEISATMIEELIGPAAE